ncbi:MAG: sulfatase-like hydrolase/transferase, partial [Saprospiraceae bacterium]|nr:sulfatase-like hydrolase/transferase [Saprospiraceae bacterium]
SEIEQRTSSRKMELYAAMLDRCKGRYDEGYEVLKSNRLNGLKKLGFVPDSVALPPYFVDVPAWDSLSEIEQRTSSRKMELYAAMLENLDYHIGRLRDSLETMQLWENTLVFFLSDNGAAHRDFYTHPTRGQFIRARYDNSYENMGKPTSFVSYGPAWAQSCMVPYKHHKTSTAEGGIIVSAILSGTNVSRGNTYQHYTSIMDLAPTFLDVAGVQVDSIYEARQVQPMRGKSMMKSISRDQSLHGPDKAFALEFNGSIYYQRGEWKLVNYRKPYRESGFELYQIRDDPAEQTDLRQQYPVRFQEMMMAWKAYQKQNGIMMQDDADAARFNY